MSSVRSAGGDDNSTAGGDDNSTAATGDGDEEDPGPFFFAAVPVVAAFTEDGGLFTVAAGSCRVLEAPNPPVGRLGDFLSRLPPRLVHEQILPHLTYRNAESARGANKFLHDWTRGRRQGWKLWPLQPMGLTRIQKSFVDWARLGDGRAFSSQHPPFVDAATGVPICPRFLRGRCGALGLCNLSHAVPTVDEGAIDRCFEEITCAVDGRDDATTLGMSLQANSGEATYLDRNSPASLAGVRVGWKVVRVGRKRVGDVRDMYDALHFYRDRPQSCLWGVGKEKEARWSSRRPTTMTFQDFQPLRPYFAVVEWSGTGGFFCAATEYFGLPWWWTHEPEILELFLQRAKLYQVRAACLGKDPPGTGGGHAMLPGQSQQ
jgi:hypothetical protein